jgi:hypothetical protein
MQIATEASELPSKESDSRDNSELMREYRQKEQ